MKNKKNNFRFTFRMICGLFLLAQTISAGLHILSCFLFIYSRKPWGPGASIGDYWFNFRPILAIFSSGVRWSCNVRLVSSSLSTNTTAGINMQCHAMAATKVIVWQSCNFSKQAGLILIPALSGFANCLQKRWYLCEIWKKRQVNVQKFLGIHHKERD